MEDKLEKYKILDHLKSGGFGDIHRALFSEDGIERIVVLKTIKKDALNQENIKESFLDEIRTSFPLTHPNIAQIYDYGEEDNKLFCVIEYIQGITVRELQKKRNKYKEDISIEHILYMMIECSNGLHYAHAFKDQFHQKEQKIVHRDISPQNIMVSYEGIIKIIDFGIAKAKSNFNTTEVGVYKGKPAYMAPEYIESKVFDHRFDQFSLGIVFWELISDQKLFTGKNYIEIIKKIHKCEIPLPRFHNENVGHELQEVILKMLHKNPRKRFRNLEVVSKELSKHLYKINPNYSPSNFCNFIQENFKSEILWENARIKNLTKKE